MAIRIKWTDVIDPIVEADIILQRLTGKKFNTMRGFRLKMFGLDTKVLFVKTTLGYIATKHLYKVF